MVAAARRTHPVAVVHTVQVVGPVHTAVLVEDLDRTAARLVVGRRIGLAEVLHIGLAAELRIDLLAAERRTDLVVAVRSLVDRRTEAVGRIHRLEDLVAFVRRS